MKKIKDVNFSRVFPAYHKKKGQQTNFVEGILTFMGITWNDENYIRWLIKTNPDIGESFLREFVASLSSTGTPKRHTIRDHKIPIKIGDSVRFTGWAGKPYNKTSEGYWKIRFAPDLAVANIYEIYFCEKDEVLIVRGVQYVHRYEEMLNNIAENDFLSVSDFLDWFKKPFNGHIICWDKTVIY